MMLFFVPERVQKHQNFRYPKTFETSRRHNFSLRPSQIKSGIQLRSQIAWTFHFWSPFSDRRHPLAVRLQCLTNFSGTKKTHRIWPLKKGLSFGSGANQGFWKTYSKSVLGLKGCFLKISIVLEENLGLQHEILLFGTSRSQKCKRQPILHRY